MVTLPWTTRWEKTAEEAGSPHRRLADRLVDMTHEVNAAAEARVFGLRAVVLANVRQSVLGSQRAVIHSAGKYALLELANGLLYFGSAVAILGWILHDAIDGTVSVAAFTIALTCLGSLQASV